jgi:hypothetical protein
LNSTKIQQPGVFGVCNSVVMVPSIYRRKIGAAKRQNLQKRGIRTEIRCTEEKQLKIRRLLSQNPMSVYALKRD